MAEVSLSHRQRLRLIAQKAMQSRGFLTEFSSSAKTQVEELTKAALDDQPSIRDLRNLLWCSIDNDDSRDLDQLTVAERLADGKVKIFVAVADVDALVTQSSPIDVCAKQNTTSIYTAAQIFPMLPTRCSTDLTSLNEHQDRLAIVVEMVIDGDGALLQSDIYRAHVRNQAKLAYNSVAGWLEGNQPEPAPFVANPALKEQLHMQDEIAQKLKLLRQRHGALVLATLETKPIFEDDLLKNLAVERQNRAKELIEDFMIAANGVTARFLISKGFPSFRRVLKEPARWQRIVTLAKDLGEELPENPSNSALEEFLARRKQADPLHFSDLSLTVIKLIGSGEYTIELPGENSAGHFGLAVKDYTHSTAPNRRFPDLITQRLLKAALKGEKKPPYTLEELQDLARHCTEQEDNANKVERLVHKSAGALLLEKKIGQSFDAIVTGASTKGTWVRLMDPPVEGKVTQKWEGFDVGDRVQVKLTDVDVDRGFIDFIGLSKAPSKNKLQYLARQSPGVE